MNTHCHNLWGDRADSNTMAKPLVRPACKELYDTFRATVLDGRSQSARYRQNQLWFLHNFLVAKADVIRSAIRNETSVTDAEVDLEVRMSLTAVRKLYENIDFGKSIQDEYRVAKGQSDLDARAPDGIVLVRPTTHTRFFSIISASATAFAAGNVVLVEVSRTSSGLCVCLR